MRHIEHCPTLEVVRCLIPRIETRPTKRVVSISIRPVDFGVKLHDRCRNRGACLPLFVRVKVHKDLRAHRGIPSFSVPACECAICTLTGVLISTLTVLISTLPVLISTLTVLISSLTVLIGTLPVLISTLHVLISTESVLISTLPVLISTLPVLISTLTVLISTLTVLISTLPVLISTL